MGVKERRRFLSLSVWGLVVAGVFLAVSSGVAQEEFPHLVTGREEVDFGECTPGSTYEETLTLFLRDVSPRWAVFVTAEKPEGDGKVLSCLSLEGPGGILEGPGREAQKFLEGMQGPAGEFPVEVRLRFAPDWNLPPGAYRFRLFFQYLSEATEPSEPPLSLLVKVTVSPSVELEVQGEGTLSFVAQGAPGMYPLEGTVRLRGRSNASLWTVRLSSEGLKGEKGGVIPPSRIFVKTQKGPVSLEKGFELGPFQGGEEVAVVLDGFLVETLLEDQPDVYEGEIRFRCLFRE